MALTVEEIKIRVTSEDSGLKKLNSEISQLETKIKNLQSAPKGNVSNFKWFKDMEVTLQNAKVAQQQLTQSNSTYSQSLQNVSGNIGGYITNLATVIALQKAWEISLNSAKFDVLRSNFKGLESDLTAFRNATAGSVSDGNLIKLSNQATDLGISLQDQTILMSLAEDAADKYGTGIEEGFTKVINATEGSVKGLKGLGIQKEVYEKIVKDLAKAHGDEIDKLDAETQKEIRIQAIIKASGVTYEQATNKVKDAADEQEALIAIVGNLTDKYGGLVVKGLIPFYGALLKLPKAIENTWTQMQELASTVQGTADVITELLSGIVDLRRESEQAIVFTISVNNGLPNAKDVRNMLPDNATLEDGIRGYMNAFNTTWEEASKKVIGDLNLGFAKENDASSSTKNNSKTKTSSNKSIKEQTELLKNLGKEAFSVSGALKQIAQLDLSTFQPLVLADEIDIVRDRIVESSQIMADALSQFAESSITAMGSFFGSLVPPQDALNPMQQLLKTILLNAISTAEGLLFAGGATAFFKAILTGGISLGPDVAFKIAGFAALEAAKGFIGAFADGTSPVSRSGMALVGERGPELIYMNKGQGVMNNVDTRAYMSRGGSGGNSDTAIYFSADLAAFTKQTKKSQRDIRQQSKWKRF